MAEVKTPPLKIKIGDQEYDAFGDEHSWRDIARWIKAHGPTDVEEFHHAMTQVGA